MGSSPGWAACSLWAPHLACGLCSSPVKTKGIIIVPAMWVVWEDYVNRVSARKIPTTFSACSECRVMFCEIKSDARVAPWRRQRSPRCAASVSCLRAHGVPCRSGPCCHDCPHGPWRPVCVCGGRGGLCMAGPDACPVGISAAAAARARGNPPAVPGAACRRAEGARRPPPFLSPGRAGPWREDGGSPGRGLSCPLVCRARRRSYRACGTSSSRPRRSGTAT